MYLYIITGPLCCCDIITMSSIAAVVVVVVVLTVSAEKGKEKIVGPRANYFHLPSTY